MIDPVVIGIGGNLGTSEAIVERFRQARQALSNLGPVRSAPLYRTAPIGPPQPSFFNTAVAVSLEHTSPTQLIAIVLELERLLGREREREARWGPRAVDLDILVWGQRVIRTPELEIPHPRLASRRFALEPVAALLGPEAVVPLIGKLEDALAQVRDQEVELIVDTW
jgi:2-amino-4-hydroxy-6-hydroxymethyldihydropteridine diphosphokinase